MITEERRIDSIQALRAIAAILVVFCHAEQFTSAFLTVNAVDYLGQCFGGFGVDIFFVVSGFIMIYISRYHFGNKSAILPFLGRRIIRIYPLYWLLTIAVLVFMIPSGLYAYALPVSEHFVIEAMRDISYLFKTLLLIPFYDASGKQLSPVIGVAWTLIYEMFFYAIFSLLLVFDRKRYFAILCGIFTALIAMQFAIHTVHISFNKTLSLYIFTYGNNLILEFIFGCFIAERYLSNKFLTNRTAYLAILFSILAFIQNYHIPHIPITDLRGVMILTAVYHVKALGCGLPAALLVYAILSLERNHAITIPTAWIKLGNASYSIYLTHFSISLVVMLALIKVLQPYIAIPGDMAVVMIWFTCIAIGYLTYRHIEFPLTHLLKSWGEKKQPPLAVQNE